MRRAFTLLVGNVVVAALNVCELLIELKNFVDECINQLTTRHLERRLFGVLLEDAGEKCVQILCVTEFDHFVNRIGNKRNLKQQNLGLI